MSPFSNDDVTAKLELLRREAEEREAERLAQKLGLKYLSPSMLSTELSALKTIPEAEARYALAAPIKEQDKEMAVAVFDPESQKARDVLNKIRVAGFSPIVFTASKTSLNKIFEHYKEIIEAPHEITSEVDIKEAELEELKKRVTNVDEANKIVGRVFSSGVSTTEILGEVLSVAMALGVSDIHFETSKDEAVLRLRIDGLLNEVAKISHEVYKQILSRVKLISGLKINVRDTPQDGRFTINFDSTEIEIRVAVSPSEFGEAIVMRVLNPKAISLSLGELGLRKDDEEIALREIKRPNGMILVTGPTGSGKTTTLYAFLKTVNDPQSKIITIEDPIEYHLSGIEQTQVDAKAGYTFASGLRSILRQDPDMLLVGEIRDLETAEIAIHASLTGHLVFSTLHTNNAVGAIPRLIDVGIKPSILAPALTLVIAQRLVRRLCKFCKKEAAMSDELRSKVQNLKSKLPARIKFYGQSDKIYEPVGCSKCNGGYKGRVGIYEFLEVGPEYEELIAKEPTESAIRKIALEKGFVEMQKDGVVKVLGGLTTFEEVEKATGLIVW